VGNNNPKRVMNVFPMLDAGGTEDVILKSSAYLIENDVEVAMSADCSEGRRKQDFIDLGIKMYDNPFARKKKKIVSNIKKFRKSIKEFRPEIVHTHALYSLGIAFLTRLIFRMDYKIVHTGHGGPKANYDSISQNFTSMADRYITLSKQSFSIISKDGKKGNVRLIYNGTSKPDESEIYANSGVPLAGEKLRMGFIGRFTKQKGLPTLIEALDIINKRLVDFELHLIGDGEDKPMIEEMVNSANLNDKVIFHGYSSSPWALLSDVPLVVMPSLWEQGALVAIEAIIRNHTIISTNINGINDVVIDGESGYLFERMDAAEFANILESLSRGERKLINISLDERREFLFPERTGVNIYNLYRELLK